jgi:hypothetical protein
MLSRIKGLDNFTPGHIFSPSFYCHGTQGHVYSALLQNLARKTDQNPIFNLNSNHIKK